MIKLIYSDQLPPTLDQRVTMIEDPDRFVKKASETFDLSDESLRPPAGYVGIHTVALGDWEHYGMNRNGDAFTKLACQKYHKTFVKHGHVFRNHDNKNPDNAIGKIAASIYNEPMGRIELIVWADEKKAAPELHKLAKEGTASFSMACVRAGTLIQTNKGPKPVEKIQVDDIVLTHTGSWKPVTALMQRKVSDYFKIQFKCWGATKLEITGNHPVLAASFLDVSGHPNPEANVTAWQAFRRRNKDELYKHLNWRPASSLVPGDYLAVPLNCAATKYVPLGLARAFGYYIADGNIGEGCITFTCNKKNDLVHEAENLLPWTSVSVRPKRNSDKAVSVHCFGKACVDLFEPACGRGCFNKHVPDDIKHASAEVKFNFAAAWFNSDGWQDKAGLHWSICNKGLAIELQQLLASVGIPATCCRICHPFDRGLIKSDGNIEYVVTAQNVYVPLFVEISKAKYPDPKLGCKFLPIFTSGNYLMVPVKEVAEIHSPEPVTVYNFSVADDESYTVFGLAVHNCRVPFDRCTVCSAIRKNAMDPRMCDHIRYDLGKIAADGTAVGTFNDEPTWFDESFVSRPADRIAWDLGKVASFGAGNEPSSIEYAKMAHIHVPESVYADTVPGYARKAKLFRKLAAYERAYFTGEAQGIKTARDFSFLQLAKAASTDISPLFLEELRTLPCSDFLKTAADKGVVFSVPVFFKYAFGRDFGSVADKMADVSNIAKNGLFNFLEKAGMRHEVCSDTYFDMSGQYAQLQLPAKVEAQLKQAFSLQEPYASARALSHVASGYPLGRIYTVKFASAESPAAVKLAASYAAYVLSALDNICGAEPDERILALSGAQNLLL